MKGIDKNLCTVVQGNTLPVFLRNMKHAGKISAMFELRADTIRGFKETDIEVLKKNTKGSVIFTCRHVSEGGEFAKDKKIQQAILKKSFSSKFNYVDVAFDNNLVKSLSLKEKKKLLLSYHSFSNTPSYKSLLATLNKMRELSPAVIKIATMVQKEKDILTLADILKQKKVKEKLIIIGMGEMGKMTRILFPLMGSYLTYIAMPGSKIAPGLMTRKEMQEMYNLITKP